MTQILDRLTPLENFMFASDEDRHPMSVIFELEFSERPPLDLLQESLNDVVNRHPLLNARIRKRGIVPYWENLPATEVEWGQASPVEILNRAPLKIEEERGIRAWQILDETGLTNRIWLDLHHACVDGVAVTDLVREWQLLYNKRFHQAAEQECPSAVESAVKERGIRKLSKFRWKHFQRIKDFYRRTNLSSVENQKEQTETPRRLSEWSLPGAVEVAKRYPELDGNRWTINDLLVASLYLAVAQVQNQGQDQLALRIGVPIDLRRDCPQQNLIANCVTLIFVDRDVPANINDEYRKSLLLSIADEMDTVVREKHSHSMLHLLKVMFPFYFLPKSASACAAVISNLGRLESRFDDFSWGDSLITRMTFFPPTRDGINLAIGVSGQQGVLHFKMLYNAELVSDCYIGALQKAWEQEIQAILQLCSQA